MAIPAFILRKLFRKESLVSHDDGTFSFCMQNPIADATVTAPPQVMVNGVSHDPSNVAVDGVELAKISADNPWLLRKGAVVEFTCQGYLLRGQNRVAILVKTREFGELDIYVEDRARTDEEE